MNRRPNLLCRFAAMLLVIVALGGSASVFAQGIPPWLTDRTKQWYTAFNAGDAAAIIRLYALNAVLFLDGEMFDGRGAIEEFHRDNFGKARFDCMWTIRGATLVDKLAVVWGDDSCIDTPRSGGAPQMWEGRWLMVYQQHADGSWLIVRDGGEESRPPRADPRR